MRKITPEIERFIYDNCSLSGDALSGLIKQKFDLIITRKAIDPYLKRSRAEKEANNAAKVEAVRSKILEHGDIRAEKYLMYLDEDIEDLRKLLLETKDIKVETARDRAAISQSLQKGLAMVLDFVKPENDIHVNITQDLSKLTDEELRQLDALTAKLEGKTGTGETPPA